MTIPRTEELLEELHAKAAAPSPSPAHREALEAELLARFDRRAVPAQRRRARFIPLLAAASLIIGVLAAARAPAEYSEELGQRIEVQFAAGPNLPGGRELGRLVEQGLGEAGGSARRIELRIVRVEGGGPLVRVDVWGAPIEGVARRLRERAPILGAAEIAVHALSGRVRTSLAGLLGHRLLKLSDPAAVEEARRALQAELEAEKGRGKVDVSVERDPSGRQRVRIEAKDTQTKTAP